MKITKNVVKIIGKNGAKMVGLIVAAFLLAFIIAGAYSWAISSVVSFAIAKLLNIHTIAGHPTFNVLFIVFFVLTLFSSRVSSKESK